MPIRSGAASFNVQEEFFGNAGFHSLAGTEPNQLLKTVSCTAFPDTVLRCLVRCCVMLVARNSLFSTQLTLRAWSDIATEPNRKIWVGFSAECGDNEQGYDIVLCWRGTMVRVRCNSSRLQRACGRCCWSRAFTPWLTALACVWRAACGGVDDQRARRCAVILGRGADLAREVAAREDMVGVPRPFRLQAAVLRELCAARAHRGGGPCSSGAPSETQGQVL